MATVNVATGGHESVSEVGADAGLTDSLTAGNVVAIVYDDTTSNAELVSALQLCADPLLADAWFADQVDDRTVARSSALQLLGQHRHLGFTADEGDLADGARRRRGSWRGDRRGGPRRRGSR